MLITLIVLAVIAVAVAIPMIVLLWRFHQIERFSRSCSRQQWRSIFASGISSPRGWSWKDWKRVMHSSR